MVMRQRRGTAAGSKGKDGRKPALVSVVKYAKVPRYQAFEFQTSRGCDKVPKVKAGLPQEISFSIK